MCTRQLQFPAKKARLTGPMLQKGKLCFLIDFFSALSVGPPYPVSFPYSLSPHPSIPRSAATVKIYYYGLAGKVRVV